MITLSTLLQLNPCLSISYVITDLSNSSGLFYNNLGTASISTSHLTLLSHVNITQLDKSHIVLKKHYSKITNLCSSRNSLTIESRNFCTQTLHIIRDQIKDIDEKSEILSHISSNEIKSRRKRGLINGVSYVLKWLIGTPDAKDAEFYTDSITSLVTENKETQGLLKSQIQVISSTIKNFNDSVNSLKLTESQLNTNFERLQQFSSNISDEINRLNIDSVVNHQLSILTSLANTVVNSYDQFINTINLGNHGIISPQIITPRILYDELIKYKGEHDLPISLDYKNIHLFYKLLKVEVVLSDKIIIFALHVPLVDKTRYNIYELIPLPIQHFNSSIFSFIIPSQPYLLLSNTKTLFALLPSLLGCVEYVDRQHLCENIHTNKRVDQPTCEVQLLSPHVHNIPKDCQTKNVVANIETWKYVGDNEWIYVLRRPTTLTLICKDQSHIEDVVLHNTGLIKLHNVCKGYTDLYVLQASSEEEKNITHHVPPISLIEDDCCIMEKKIPQTDGVKLNPVRLANIDLSELKFAKKKLNEFDEVITEHMKKPQYFPNMKWYSILASILVALLFIWCCINCCSWCGCLSWIRKICCVAKPPRDDSDMPTLIKNIITCNFERERPTSSRQLVSYNREREDVCIPTCPEEFNIETNKQHGYYTRSRKSTTPF